MNYILEAVNDFRHNHGISDVVWCPDLENDCYSHAQYMLFNKTCSHAPDHMLNGVHFECVGCEWRPEYLGKRDSIRSLVFTVLGESDKHKQHMLDAMVISGAYQFNIDEYNALTYICLRGYLSI